MSVRVTAPHGRSARRSSPSGCSPPRAAVTTAGAAPARPRPEARERPRPEVRRRPLLPPRHRRRAASSCSASRPTPEARGSRRRRSSRSRVTPSSRSVFDSARARDGRRQGRAVPRRVDHAERRLHGLDDQGALGRHVPRRHAVRRRGDRRQPHPPVQVVPHRQGASPTSRPTPTARRRSSSTR